MTSIEKFLEEVEVGQENAISIVREMLPDGKENITLAMQNRILQPEQPKHPQKRQSPARAHVFHDIDGFVEYLEEYRTENTVVLTNVEAQSICAILDDKAYNGFETIRMQPIIHPLFEAWESLLDVNCTVNTFAEFIMSNRRQIIDPDGRETALLFGQIRAAINTTIQKGRGKSSINGIMVETEIQGERNSEPVELPETITIECPLYVGTEPIRIEFDLLVHMSCDEVAVRMSSSQVKAARIDIFMAMIENLRSIGKLLVGLGQPDHRDWNYLS